MSDDPSRNNEPRHPKKGFFSLLLDQLFHDEPKNRDDLLALIRDAAHHDLIDADTRDMLEGVMAFAEYRIGDIMVPRSQMVTLKADQSLESCLAVIIESAHSRFPVLSEEGDHVVGILMAKDLLPFMRSDARTFNMADILRPAAVVPESQRVDRMLKTFRAEHYHMAIVIDEFGSVAGLVTIEDILELIVGDIEDEYDDDDEEETIRPLSANLYSVSALTPVERFNDYFGTDFSDEEMDTIGGLILQEMGHLPARGESVTLAGYQFTVTAADNRRIIQLQVTAPDPDAAPHEEP